MHEEDMNLVVLSDEPWNWCICIASLSLGPLSRRGTRALRSRVSVPHTGYSCRTNREFPFAAAVNQS